MTYICVKVLTILFLYIEVVFLRATGEVVYEAEFSENFKSCKDFDNKYIYCDSFVLGLVEGDEDAEGGIGVSGAMEITQNVDKGYKVSIEVWKLMDVGKEFTFASVSDVCESLKSEDAPWYPLVVSMNVSDCPVPAKTYPIQDLLISLDFAKDFLCVEFCGEYEVMLSVLNENEEQISCYVLGVSITESEKDTRK